MGEGWSGVRDALASRLALGLRGRGRRVGAAVVLALLALLGLDRLFPPDLTRYQQTSLLITDRRGEILRAFTTPDEAWRLAVRPDQVDQRYLALLLAYEDRNFRRHPGIDPLAVIRAFGQWARVGRPVSGASTLTMQAVRALEPRPRTLLSKLLEMLRALQLEAHYSKDEILSIYLTLAPFGGNLEGVRAASLAYFGKEPAQLSTAQAALLVALPQSPERRRPDRHPEQARKALSRVLDRLQAAGALTAKDAAEARQEVLPAHRAPLPFDAAHLAAHFHGRSPAGQAIRTTIDASLQRDLEAMVEREARQFQDGATIAALVVENGSGRVRAWVGGHDFFAPAGQVDVVLARRSPGSTLKPFIYGLAFDDLALHPQTLLMDQAMRFGDYAPQNFDRDFHGQVTVREALQQSLNVPAIAVMDRVGADRFTSHLRDLGVHLAFPKNTDRPGLPIALGGVGISLADLTMLYAALADDGKLRPLQVEEAAALPEPHPLVSPLAAWYLTDILADSPRPDSFVQAGSQAAGRRVAYKTGTSYGFRDAWALGWSGQHTIGIWVARADGTPRPGNFGRNAAAPLLFQAFDLLPGEPGLPPKPPPPGAILAATTQSLPQGLQHFRPGPGAQSNSDGPRILFPPDGAVVDLAQEGASLLLKAEGGVPPLHWLVNGLPVTNLNRRADAFWQPDSEGFAKVTVVDSLERAVTAEVRVKYGTR